MRKTVFFLGISVSLAFVLVSCTDLVDPVEVTTHPTSWSDPTSADFHGEMVLQSVSKSGTCKSCHGTFYQGGEARVSCMRSGCHVGYPHSEDFGDPQSDNSHTTFIADQLWDLSICTTCHGADYAGAGYEQKNCLTCHTEVDGPEACNTCHGSTENDAPPKGLYGITETTARGVGAHQTHLGESALSAVITPDCDHCHVSPSTFAEAGHIDTSTPGVADVAFGLFPTQDETLPTLWDPAVETCSDVYCHGAFVFNKSESSNTWAYTADVIIGNNVTIPWTDVGSGQAECGTCHGLPPTGHLPASTCNTCHPRVVDAGFNIIDNMLHINGQADVF